MLNPNQIDSLCSYYSAMAFIVAVHDENGNEVELNPHSIGIGMMAIERMAETGEYPDGLVLAPEFFPSVEADVDTSEYRKSIAQAAIRQHQTVAQFYSNLIAEAFSAGEELFFLNRQAIDLIKRHLVVTNDLLKRTCDQQSMPDTTLIEAVTKTTNELKVLVFDLEQG